MKQIKQLVHVFIISFSVLCYEISLIRIFSIVQWYDFAYFSISLALLGFGISGVFVYIFQSVLLKNIKSYIFRFNMAFLLSVPLCFFAYLQVPFNSLLVGIDKMQAVYFIIDTLLMMIPFFFGAAIIVIYLMLYPADSIYFSNLAGSASGVVGCYVLMEYVHPFNMIYIILIALSFSLLLSSYPKRSGSRSISLKLAVIILTFFSACCLAEFLNLIKISEFKAFSMAENLPDYRLILEKSSPQSLISVVSADGFRKPGDLSYSYSGVIPEAFGIFYDYDNPSAIYKYDGTSEDLEKFDFLLKSPAGLAHFILQGDPKKKSLILGVGGGSGILRSLITGFGTIDGVEYDKNVIEIMQDDFAVHTGEIYNLDNVMIHCIDARSYIETSKDKYQLIEIEMLDSFVSSTSGVASIKENYLYTIESFSSLWEMLSSEGILSISRWIRVPPRDSFKILNTVYDCLRMHGIKEPGGHLISIRGPLSINILLLRSRADQSIIKHTKNFCEENGFDLVYYPGISKNEINRYFIKEEADLYNGFISLLDHNSRDQFIKDYIFDIKPANDNKPYFSNFFKYPVIRNIIRKSGTRELEFSQWGYFSLLIMLVPTALISIIFIFLPLLYVSKKTISINFQKISLLIFYFSIGLAFFFVEIVMIQKLILFLGHPVSSMTIVISSMLCFSGIGSYFSQRKIFGNLPIRPLILIILLIPATYIMINYIFPELIMLPYGYKAILSVMALFPVSFFMGMPFPKSLEYIKKAYPELLPWCWGTNGFASVNSIFICAIISLIYGFRTVFTLAVAAYLLCLIILLCLSRDA